MDSKPTPAEVRSWLSGDDQRMVAWGAYFAGKQKDDGEVTLLLRRVLSWTRPPDQPSESKGQREYAMRNVLDALIQRREVVPVEGIKAIADSFPEQAMILASRLPFAETSPLLMDWYGDGASSDWAWRPRVAAMMLAKAPPPGFAASVLALSEEKLTVTVWDDGTGRGQGTGSNSCGDSIGGEPPKGWPPEFGYILEENKPEIKDLDKNRTVEESVVVISGGDRITCRRIEQNRGHGSCSMVHGLSPENRHPLIAEMLGVSDTDVSWKAQETASIHWMDADRYRAEIAVLIAREERRFKQTADALAMRGQLTKAESATVRPWLAVTVYDGRRSKDAPLPSVVSDDPRTVVSLYPGQD